VLDRRRSWLIIGDHGLEIGRPMTVKRTPRRLTEGEFKATIVGRMVDIKGREDVVRPDGVIALDPYLRAVAADIAPLELLPDAAPAGVYTGGRYDHVLYPCNRSNVYLVVVVTRDDVHGHYVLDLQEDGPSP
jgi:hypothetical protein